MERADAKRWTKISLRTLHLLGVAGVGGGLLFGLEKPAWLGYWWLTLITGGLIMLMDMVSNPVWIAQVRGLVVVVKLGLLAFLGVDPAWDRILLIIIIVVSTVISHAPGKLRYYSVYHRRVITTDRDTKG